ncbi:hypothetical protein EK904_001625 [Melospiza melodia maxima]|nr:hypothetical protein EK904_001625 [Melospiza melodia maxima]
MWSLTKHTGSRQDLECCFPGAHSAFSTAPPYTAHFWLWCKSEAVPKSTVGKDVPLKQDVQGGILHPAHRQDSLRNQDNVLVPIHPPLIINLSDEEDDEEDDEDDDDEDDNYVSTWMPKTVIDIEEERAIRDICYKSGDGNTIPIRFNNTRKEKESSERRVSIETIPRTDLKSFDSGGGGGSVIQRSTFIDGNRFEALPREKEPIISKYSNVKETNYTELVKNHHFKEVKENKRISDERRNSASAVTGKGIHTPDPKGKPGYQQRGQSKDDETASSSPYGRDTGRYNHLNSPEPRRSAYVVYRTVTQKPKFNGPTDFVQYLSPMVRKAPNKRISLTPIGDFGHKRKTMVGKSISS